MLLNILVIEFCMPFGKMEMRWYLSFSVSADRKPLDLTQPASLWAESVSAVRESIIYKQGTLDLAVASHIKNTPLKGEGLPFRRSFYLRENTILAMPILQYFRFTAHMEI